MRNTDHPTNRSEASMLDCAARSTELHPDCSCDGMNARLLDHHHEEMGEGLAIVTSNHWSYVSYKLMHVLTPTFCL